MQLCVASGNGAGGPYDTTPNPEASLIEAGTYLEGTAFAHVLTEAGVAARHFGAAVTRRDGRPARVVFADTDAGALNDLRAVAARADVGAAHLSFVHVRTTGDCDRLVTALPTPALVVNATGLGTSDLLAEFTRAAAPGKPQPGLAR